MTEREFWRLVRRADRARRRHAAARDELRRRCRLSDSRETLIQLGRQLEELPLTEIVRFHQHLVRLHRLAYGWPLWTAFGIALAGADRKDLRDGVCWLILSGRRTFRRALADPDLLGALAVDPGDIADAGALTTLAAGILLPEEEHEPDWSESLFELTCYVDPPGGEPVHDDLAELRRRFPKLTSRHLPESPGTNGPFVLPPAQWCPGLDQTGAPR
jgi:hypothetical protein